MQFVTVFQHYIELSSHYQRPRTAVHCSTCDESCGLLAASLRVARQQSMESGVFMSRPASPDLDSPSPRGYQRPVRSPSRRSSDAAAVSTHLPRVARRRSQSSIDRGYLLPTCVDGTPTAGCQHLSASHRQSVSAASDSDLWGSVESESDNVFQNDARLWIVICKIIQLFRCSIWIVVNAGVVQARN